MQYAENAFDAQIYDLCDDLSTIKVTNFVVESIEAKYAREFTEKHHYSKTCPNGIVNFGLFYNGNLIGAAVFGQVIGRFQAQKYYPKNPDKLIELRRLCCIDKTKRNTESFFLGKCFKLLKKTEYEAILSLADTNYGHEGTIYKATNFTLLGQTEKDGHPRVFIDDVERHPRDLYDKHGSSSIPLLKSVYGDRIQFREKKPKNIYILYIKKQKLV